MIAPCGCPNGSVPCERDITQEDMLCDDCRAGYCTRSAEAWWEAMAELRKEAARMMLDANGQVVQRVSLWSAPAGGVELEIPPT